MCMDSYLTFSVSTHCKYVDIRMYQIIRVLHTFVCMHVGRTAILIRCKSERE